MKNELYARLAARVHLGTVADLRELSSRYDRVVVTGSPCVAKELGCWSDIMRTWVRGAVVGGSFDLARWLVWYNKSHADADTPASVLSTPDRTKIMTT